MFRMHLLSSSLSVLFGILLLVWIIPTQTPEYPGYGMPASLLPEILAWIIIAAGGINLIKTVVTGAGKSQDADFSLHRFLHLAAFIAVLSAAMPLMELIGYWGGSAVIMALLCVLCGERRPVRLAIVSAVSIALVWLALWKGLSVMLPGM